MSELTNQHERDDELLSAYLDDELSADERAAVEARLSADPTAQDLLHQLRAVSQAVQGLPQEMVGQDLSESILRRVEQSKRSPGVATLVARDFDGVTSTHSKPVPAQLDPSIPSITIGRTRRGWIWASLAAAAAVLVMVFQSDQERDQNLPPVAQRDEPLAELERLRGPIAPGDLEMRALEEPAAEPAVTDLAVRDQTAPVAPRVAEPTDDFFRSDGLSAAPVTTTFETAPSLKRAREAEAKNESISDALDATPAPPAASTVALGLEPDAPSDDAMPTNGAAPSGAPAGEESDLSADTLAVETRERLLADGTWDAKPGESGAAPSEKPDPAAPTVDDPLLIVRVLTKPAALENNTFGRLLAAKGIEVAPDVAQDASGTVAAGPARRRFVEGVEENRGLERRVVQEGEATSSAATMTNEELVLVNAPQSAIESCLEVLNQDRENYLSVAVTDATADESKMASGTSTADGYSAAPEAAFSKQRAEQLGLSKYSRGDFPRPEWSMRDKDLYYYQFNVPSDNYAAGGYGGGRPSNGLGQLRQQNADSREATKQNAATLGQAVRLKAWGNQDLQAREQLVRRNSSSAQAQGAATELGRLQSQLRSTAQSGADTLQVLFVLRPGDERASSPAARNKAQ
jgi:DNA-binding FrmR family transcriptional regulator